MGEETNRQRNTEILVAYEAKINAATVARRAREREEAERQRLADIKQAIERAEAIKKWVDRSPWMLADIPEPMKTGLHSFGYDDGLLEGRTDLLAVVLKIRLKVVKKESEAKIGELWREKWDLKKKASELDAIQERMKPAPKTGDRAIVLE